MVDYRVNVLNKERNGGVVYVDFECVDVESGDAVFKYDNHNMTVRQAEKLEARVVSISMINLESKGLESFPDESSSTDMIESNVFEVVGDV